MRFVYSILLVLIFAACAKESKIYIPYDGDKIVLNSMIQPDSLIYIRVTQSKEVRVYGNLQFPELSNATVTLYENGVALPTPQRQVINGYGYYVSAGVAQEGALYSIGVEYKGLTSVSAADSTPARPVIKDAYAQRSNSRLRFTLSDNAAETNYYSIRFFNADSVNGALVINRTDTLRCRLDPSFENNFVDIIGNNYYSEITVSDERINGKETSFVMQTQKQLTTSHIILEVRGLTEGAYKYLLATYTQRQDEGNPDVTFDPVNIYSNVQNGYGIVAGVNARVLSFKVE
jgi:hypothetical protein